MDEGHETCAAEHTKQLVNVNAVAHIKQLHYCFQTRAGLRHWGPHAKVSWGPSLFLPSPSLSGPFLHPPLFPLPLPPVPSSAISLPSFYLISFRSGHLNTAMWPGERCKLPQWDLPPSGVWGEAPADKRFGAYLIQKGLLWWQQFFYRVSRKNICNFHYFLHKNN